MNLESKSTIGRGARRTALGASLALAAAGALAVPPAFAAEAVSVTSTPQTGVAFTASASGLTAGTSYRIILAGSTAAGDVTNVADAGECATTAKAVASGSTTLTCTLTESTAGTYQVKLLDAAGTTALASAPVTVRTTTAAPTAPTATDVAGTASDKVTVAKIEGVNWTVDGAAVTFAPGATTADVLVPDQAARVVATAAPGYALPAGARTTWDFVFDNTSPLTTVTAPTPTSSDPVGTATDTVTVTKTTGITWTVNGAAVTFAPGATTATVYVTTGTDATVVATAATGYMFAGNLKTQSFTVKLTNAKAEPTLTRLAGENRMDTAVEISKKYWAAADTVYIANGLRFADALTAGPAAAKDGGPLLLTMQDSVPANVLAELQRLKPARIHLVGGTSVLSDNVAKTLGAVAPVTRLSGNTRYETAAAVSGRWADGSKPVVYLALGENFPDALSGGSGAAIEEGALLLAQSTTLTQPTVDAIKRLAPSKVVLVGGTDVLSEAVRLQAVDLVGAAKVFRYAGKDRYATSAEVAVKSGSADATDKTLFMATGLNFPDALAGVPAADKLGAPLFLSQPTCVPPSVKTVINTMTSLTEQVRLGSSGVLGDFPLSTVCAS